jgi:hypothetical protein
MSTTAAPTLKEQRELLVESQRRASKSYYESNKYAIKAASTKYFGCLKDAINERGVCL